MIEIKVRELGGVHRVLVVRTEWRSRPKVVFYEDTKTAHAATTRAAALKVIWTGARTNVTLGTFDTFDTHSTCFLEMDSKP